MKINVRNISLTLFILFALFSTSEELKSKKGLLHLLEGKLFSGISKKGIKNFMPILGDTFYEVDKGNLYRSRQLNERKIKKVIKKYSIQTIVNLRGANPGKQWYDNEIRIAQENNVEHIDIPMSAVRLPTIENVKQMIYSIERAKKPIWVHCYGGSDRTGLFCAIYKLLNGASKKKAKKQLHPFYKHINPQTYAMDKFIKIWVDREWVLNEYDPENY